MPAIKIENLSKRYIIGHQRQERYTALRDVMMHKLRGVGQRLRHPLSPNKEVVDVEEFWALQDINLEIQQGDRVGIIGRNGAGKSTMLKILSRITEPTTGRITINGRVASLLEVGTGFHPELTGRENIFLNGAILGMSRAEIKRKFDEIVDFSGTEKFLDTPVKRYSSGMYVRLVFVVAANLEPEILIVDEVLAVGDAEFQKKCLGKMEDVGKEGRTVLFVSHNIAAVQQLTTTSIYLKEGRCQLYGNTDEVVTAYSKYGRGGDRKEAIRTTDERLAITSISFVESQNPGFNKPLVFDFEMHCKEDISDMDLGVGIFNSIHCRLSTSRLRISLLKNGRQVVTVRITDHRLPPGDYMLSLGISVSGSGVFYNESVLNFQISDAGVTEPGLTPYLHTHRDKIGAFNPATYEIGSI